MNIHLEVCRCDAFHPSSFLCNANSPLNGVHFKACLFKYIWRIYCYYIACFFMLVLASSIVNPLEMITA